MVQLKNRRHLPIFIGLIIIYLTAGNALLWNSYYINKLMSSISLTNLASSLALNRPVEYKNNFSIVNDVQVHELIHLEENGDNRIYSVKSELPDYPEWYRLFINLEKRNVPYTYTAGKHYATTNAIYYISEHERKIIWKRKIFTTESAKVSKSTLIDDSSMKQDGEDFEVYSKTNQLDQLIPLNNEEKRKEKMDAISAKIQLSGFIIIALYGSYITVRTKSIFKGGLYAYTLLSIVSFLYYIWIPGALSYNGYKAASEFFFASEPVIVGVIGVGWFFTFSIAAATRGVNILFDIRKQRNAVGTNY